MTHLQVLRENGWIFWVRLAATGGLALAHASSEASKPFTQPQGAVTAPQPVSAAASASAAASRTPSSNAESPAESAGQSVVAQHYLAIPANHPPRFMPRQLPDDSAVSHLSPNMIPEPSIALSGYDESLPDSWRSDPLQGISERRSDDTAAIQHSTVPQQSRSAPQAWGHPLLGDDMATASLSQHADSHRYQDSAIAQPCSSAIDDHHPLNDAHARSRQQAESTAQGPPRYSDEASEQISAVTAQLLSARLHGDDSSGTAHQACASEPSRPDPHDSAVTQPSAGSTPASAFSPSAAVHFDDESARIQSAAAPPMSQQEAAYWQRASSSRLSERPIFADPRASAWSTAQGERVLPGASAQSQDQPALEMPGSEGSDGHPLAELFRHPLQSPKQSAESGPLQHLLQVCHMSCLQSCPASVLAECLPQKSHARAVFMQI